MRLLALFSIEEVFEVFQHGQVFKLKTRGADGQPLWAYRYRLDGRGSVRRQVGGFATRAEAEERFGRCWIGSAQVEDGQRSRSPSSPTSTWRCIRRRR